MVSAFIFQCEIPSSNLRKSAYVLSPMRVHASHTTKLLPTYSLFLFLSFLRALVKWDCACTCMGADALTCKFHTKNFACARVRNYKTCVHTHILYNLWRIHTHVLPQRHARVHVPLSRIDTRFWRLHDWLGLRTTSGKIDQPPIWKKKFLTFLLWIVYDVSMWRWWHKIFLSSYSDSPWFLVYPLKNSDSDVVFSIFALIYGAVFICCSL